MLIKRILYLLALVVLPSVMLAQVTTSNLTGSVKGTGNEMLSGATVTAVHQPSGTRYVSTTSASGQFTMQNMRPGGPYVIEVSYVGLKSRKYDDIYLKLAETFVLDIEMESSGNLETVVVAAGRRNSVFNSTRDGAVTNISSRELQRLPTISRGLNDFTRLTPQSNGQSIGGGNFRQNYITIDGADFNNNFGIGGNLPAGGSPISLDALEEVSVNITPFDVRQSGFIGSSINAVTRSGSNQFSGSVYHYFYNERLRGFKVKDQTFNRIPTNFKQYGVRLGGPIIKDKLFFFVNYETDEEPRQVQTRVASTPENPFDVSNNNIARPTVQELTNISNYLRETYGYETGGFQGYNTAIERTKILGRIDWNITNNHRFNIRYSRVEGSTPNPVSGSRSPLTGFANGQGRTNNNALWFENSNYDQGADFTSIAAELNSTFGKLGNTFRFSYTDQDDSRKSNSADFPFVDILKDGQPFTSFGYEPFSKGNIRRVEMFNITNNLSWTTGKHAWTVGAQAEFSTTTNGFQRFATGYYTFNSWEDFIGGVNPTDYAITYSLAPGFAQAFPQFKFAQYSAYGQDEISLNKQFRLTLGLRLDLPTFPEKLAEHPLVSPLRFANNEQLNTANLPKSRLLMSPRVGFNWDIKGDRSFQLRGGTGIFTGRIPFVWIVSQAGDAGMLQVTQTFSGANVPGPFSPDPRAYLPANPPAAGTVIPNVITIINPDFKMPQTWKTSLGLDKKLGAGFVLSMEAILNKDLNAAFFRNPNLVEPTRLSVAGYPDTRTIYPASNADKFINNLTNAGTVTPTATGAFNTIVLDNSNQGYYFSFTTKVDKTFSKGFFGSLAYTYSLSSYLFDGGGDQPLSAWQGTANVGGSNNAQMAQAGFIVPHRIVGVLSYRKEFLKHLGTTISLFYNGSHDGRFSYVYSADFDRDGTNNDLMYVPRNPSEITFVTNTLPNGTTFTPQQQSDAFFRFIEQDKYLSSRRGKYAERNAGLFPWRHVVDVKFLQDIFTNIGGKRNTLQFSADILNFGNLLNRNWSTAKFLNTSSPLLPANVNNINNNTRPTFRMRAIGDQLVSSTFSDLNGPGSTFSIQFGFRYIFN